MQTHHLNCYAHNIFIISYITIIYKKYFLNRQTLNISTRFRLVDPTVHGYEMKAVKEIHLVFSLNDRCFLEIHCYTQSSRERKKKSQSCSLFDWSKCNGLSIGEVSQVDPGVQCLPLLQRTI